MSDYWKTMAPDYPTLNTKLKGLPSALLASSNPTPPTPRGGGVFSGLDALFKRITGLDPEKKKAEIEDYRNKELAKEVAEHPGLASAASGISSGVNAFTMGGSDALQKVLHPSSLETEKAIQASDPKAAQIGNIAGSVAGMALPGVGSATIAKAPGFLNLLARAGVNAAGVAVPSAIGEAIDTGNVGEAAKRGAVNLGVGTGLGTAVEGAFSLLGPRLQKILQNANIRAAGISPKAFKSAVRSSTVPFGGGPAAQANKGNSLRQKLSDYITENKAYGEPAQEKLLDALHEQWNNIGRTWDDSGKKVSDLFDKILSDETVKQGVSTITNGEDALLDLMGNAEKQKNLGSLRSFLMDKIKLGARSGDEAVAAKGLMARGIRDVVDNHVMELSPDLAEAKRLYAITRPIENAVAAKASGLGSPLIHKGSSDTFMRLASAAIFGGSGAALGGPVGAMAGNAVGQALNSLVSEGLGKAGGMAAGKLDQLLGRAGGKLNISKLPAVAPTIISNAVQNIPPQGDIGTIPMAPIPEPDKPKIIGSQAGSEGSIQGKEGSLDEGSVQDARGQTISKYQARIQRIIDNEYKLHLEPYGVDYKDYQNAVMSKIGDGKGGIDPKLAAPVLFPAAEQRIKFLRDYDKALALKGIDVNAALGYGASIGQGGLQQAGGELANVVGAGGEDAIKSKKAYQDLSGLLGSLAPTVDKSSDKQRDAQVREDISTIKKIQGTPEEKQKLIEELVQNRYGVDLNQMREFGLYG